MFGSQLKSTFVAFQMLLDAGSASGREKAFRRGGPGDCAAP
jgi:hypothetical protein